MGGVRADRGGDRHLEVAAHRADVDEVLAPRGEGRQAVEELVQRAAQRPYSMPLLVGVRVSKIGKISNILQNFANFWRARSRLYQSEILQENMRLTAFFKLYKICILLHCCNLKIFSNKSV